ncbi:MAG: outer membrane protein transport protein [Candidatus Aminicenantes bacterium]|nr:outer membrane protein transport protein [Candidatus Aminicenantes bacterium]
MKRERVVAAVGVLTAVLALFPAPASSQLILGQYQVEAPLRTWNTFPFSAAAALGRGGGAFTLASDASAATSNPALLTGLPKFQFHVNGSYHVTELFKYGPVNTGVLRTDGNIGLRLAELDFVGLAFRLDGWSFALNVSQAERFDRPEASYEETYSNSSYKYLLRFTQTGWLRTFNFSVGRRIGPRLSVGIGLNYVSGRLAGEMLEQETPTGYTLLDKKSQDLDGFYVQGGLLFEISDAFKTAIVLRTPYSMRTKNNSTVRFTYTPSADTDIGLTTSSEDTARQPLILGFGLSCRVLPEWTLAVDATYVTWSKYALDYFGERQTREFRDIVRISAGAEYGTTARIFGVSVQVPLRIGFIYDPQPMKDPRSAYACFTFGNGVYWRRLRLDMGALLGRESGSGNRLAVKRFAVSLGFSL